MERNLKQYINLHNHTHGSLLDGISRPQRYAEKAKKDGSPAIVSTDHGNLHSLMDMKDAADEVGLKYAPGQEFYQARKTRFDRDPDEMSGRARSEWDQRGPYHLTVLAYSDAGYRNLLKLSSKAFTEGYLVKPRIDHQLLSEHAEGLVVLSGCLSGEVQQAILRGDTKYALDAAAKMQSIVGKDNYFIEIMDHSIEEERRCHTTLVEISKKIGAPIVATCDSHYTHKHEADLHDTSLCINTGAKKAEEDRFKFYNDEFYLKTYAEMAAIFSNEYLDNTMLIYDKISLDLSSGGTHFPVFKIPNDEPIETYFPKRIRLGADQRFGTTWDQDPEITDRLRYETNIIKQLGFENYFLVVADIVQWAKNNGILCGPSRGSVGGSLVAYVFGITEINPLKYGLSFDRFLVYKPATDTSPAEFRNEPPDIDLDFEDRYRDKVMDYTRRTYGGDRIVNIGTFGKMGAKSAVRDICRVMDMTYELGDKISKTMPPSVFGVAPTLEKCMESQQFRTLYSSNENVKTIVDAAKDLEGMWRSVGMHASGVVIADAPVINYIPVLQKGEGQPVVTQWEMNRTEQCGLLKIDFLGLRNLTILSMTEELIKERKGIELGNLYDLPNQPDPAVFESLSRGENVGVFQMESTGMRDLMLSLKPTDINDIAACLALYRPGPMSSNVHHEYAARKNHRKAVSYAHPSLEPILGTTYGLMLYQEQLLAIAQRIAGKNIMEADELRKIVGKKIVNKMAAQRGSFVIGCLDTVGMPTEVAEKLFDEIEHHASYSFGAGHAYGYAMISYVTAYLKLKYPIEYMTAALSASVGDTDRLAYYIGECKRLGLDVKRPSINLSEHDFIIRDKSIYFGLDGINGFGPTTVKSILKERDSTQPYVNLFDFLRRTSDEVLNKKSINQLLKSGALDEVLTLEEFDQPHIHRNEKIGVLFEEADQLGVFLVEHPFTDLKDLVLDKMSHKVSEIDYGTQDKTVKLGGIIRSVDKKNTKAGKRMFNFYIEDDTNSIEVVVFPKAAESLPEIPFRAGELIVVEGRVRINNLGDSGDPMLMYQSHETIDYGDISTTPTIFLEPKKELSTARLSQIRDIIKGSKGSCKVIIKIPTSDDHFVMIKFDTTTSHNTESILRKLIEV